MEIHADGWIRERVQPERYTLKYVITIHKRIKSKLSKDENTRIRKYGTCRCTHTRGTRTRPRRPGSRGQGRHESPSPPASASFSKQTELKKPRRGGATRPLHPPLASPPVSSSPYAPLHPPPVSILLLPLHGSAGSLGCLDRRRHVRGGGEPGARRPPPPLRQGHPEGAA
jgi:hypothetical protein